MWPLIRPGEAERHSAEINSSPLGGLKAFGPFFFAQEIRGRLCEVERRRRAVGDVG